MAVLVCKMCNAPLELLDKNLARCSYCGTLYTLPLEDNLEQSLTLKAEPLLERAKMYLDDGRFESAAAYFEKVLDIIPSLGEAYLGKGMAQLEVSEIRELFPIRKNAQKNYSIRKALIFCRGEQLSQLRKALGMREERRSTNSWLTRVTQLREEFAKALHEVISKKNPGYSEEHQKIVDSFKSELDLLYHRLSGCEADIRRINRDKSAPVPEGKALPNYDAMLDTLFQERGRLNREITRLENERGAALDKLEKECFRKDEQITRGEFEELTRDYELPPLPDQAEGTCVDKVMDVVLSSYHFWTLEEILQHPYCTGIPGKRVQNSLKKLLLDKRIIEEECDGVTVYAGPDMGEIEIVN